MKNYSTIQGILSIGALICIVVGWFPIFPENISQFLYQKVFYILIGLSFLFMAPFMVNKKYTYPMYIAALICIFGAFIPQDYKFSVIKTVGLLIGVVLSLINRPRIPRA